MSNEEIIEMYGFVLSEGNISESMIDDEYDNIIDAVDYLQYQNKVREENGEW